MSLQSQSLSPFNLVLAKLLYTCVALSLVGWSKFQAIFFLRNGLTVYQIGVLKSLGLVLKFVGEPFWCMVADLNDRNIVFSFCIFMQITTLEIFRWVPVTFQSVLFVKILRMSTSPSSSFTNVACFELTKGTKEGYGQQRMFGSLAWGLGATLVGYLIDSHGIGAVFWCTYFFNICCFILVFVGLRKIIPAKSLGMYNSFPPGVGNGSTSDNSGKGNAERDIMSDVKEASRGLSSGAQAVATTVAVGATFPSSLQCSWKQSRQAVLQYMVEFKSFFRDNLSRHILVNVILYGIVLIVPDSLLSQSLEKDFKASRTMNGLVTGVATLAGMPFFYYSDHLIAIYGHGKVMVVAELSCIVRLFLLWMVPVTWKFGLHLIVVMQIINGLNFALFWSACIDLFRKISPKDLIASSMAALNVSFFTVSGVFGNAFWGWVYEHYGIYNVYLLSTAMLIGVLLHLSSILYLIHDSVGSGSGERLFAAAAAAESSENEKLIEDAVVVVMKR